MTTQIDGQARSNTVRSTSSEPGLSEIMIFSIYFVEIKVQISCIHSHCVLVCLLLSENIMLHVKDPRR